MGDRRGVKLALAGCGAAAGYALWLRRECRTDALTGMDNRRGFERTLHGLVRRGRPFALCLLDVDAFKSINDDFGHLEGDAVLQELSRRLRRAVGDRGRISRFGGDEFAVFLTGQDARRSRCEALVRDLQDGLAAPWVLNGRTLPVTVSGGVGVFLGRGEGAADVVRRADRALYKAKAAGGGRFLMLAP